MFYKKKYKKLLHILYLQYDALLVQKRQYESMLNREPPFELDQEREIQVKTLLTEANSRIEVLKQIFISEGICLSQD